MLRLGSIARPLRFVVGVQRSAPTLLRTLSSDSKVGGAAEPGDAVVAEPLKNAKGEVRAAVCSVYWSAREFFTPIARVPQVVKTWGGSVELPAVTKAEAEKAYLQATDFKQALTPPIQEAVKARDDMLTDRFNYVAENVTNPNAQYIVMGQDGKSVAPAAIGQGSFMIAGLCVLLSGIATVVYIKTQWKVNSAMELGDRLRAKGAERKEMLERSNSAKLVRSVSQNAEKSVKENVEIVRRPSQQLGSHLDTSFKGARARLRAGFRHQITALPRADTCSFSLGSLSQA